MSSTEVVIVFSSLLAGGLLYLGCRRATTRARRILLAREDCDLTRFVAEVSGGIDDATIRQAAELIRAVWGEMVNVAAEKIRATDSHARSGTYVSALPFHPDVSSELVEKLCHKIRHEHGIEIEKEGVTWVRLILSDTAAEWTTIVTLLLRAGRQTPGCDNTGTSPSNSR